jgi:phage FluMu gp28-like protein
MQWTERAQFLVDSLDLTAATGVEGARWEMFQIEHLCDDGHFSIENKSRQIAWSWLAAVEAVAEAVLYGQSSIFVSINQVEAAEKIRYARASLEALRLRRLPKLTRDNELGLELENGARLLSLPARPPRGKARMNLYLDEFAHVAYDRQIYTAALPVISKGGRLRIGSSPLGASGVFWEVFSQQLRRYPGYARRSTPWWHVWSFCTDVATAVRLAPGMTTSQRVERFGNERIQAIWANMPEEDFRQEYEAEFVDETTAWITWEEIAAVQRHDLACVLASGVEAALPAMQELLALIRAGQAEPALACGVDIGRTRNTTEIYLVGLATTGELPLRLAITLDNVEFDDQLGVLISVLTQLPVLAMLIDRNGIGANLAETMQRRYPGRALGVAFTNQSKLIWATDAKTLIQQRKPLLPADREIGYQIHSIKRIVTPARNLVFDTARNEKHHADKFWAWALALAAAAGGLPGPDETVGMADRVEISPY